MERVIPLEGGVNFRDLGGYETADGRRVRWRTLFRSGVMSYLTERDEELVRSFGIRVVCDLRTRQERDRETVRWPGSDVIRLHWDYDPSNIVLQEHNSPPLLSAEDARRAILAFFRKLPFRFEQQYRALFGSLAAGEVPLVFGCSAGKDRTGLAAALLLTFLGVKPKQVDADFTLTNEVVDLERCLTEKPEGRLGIGEDQRYLLELQPHVRAPLLRASPEYLHAAFDQIRTDCGSMEAYMQARLGVGSDAREQLCAHLLEESA